MPNGNSLLVGGGGGPEDKSQSLQVGGGTEGQSFDIEKFPAEVRDLVLRQVAKVPLVQSMARIEAGRPVKEELTEYFKKSAERAGGGATDPMQDLQIHVERNEYYAQLVENGMDASKAFTIANITPTKTESENMFNFAMGFIDPLSGNLSKEAAEQFSKKVLSKVKGLSKEAVEKIKVSIERGEVSIDDLLPNVETSVKNAGDMFDALPTIADDVKSRDTAATMTEINGKKGVEGFEKELKAQFEDWVDTRAAANIDEVAARKAFRDLDGLGMQAIDDIQSGKKVQGLDDIRKFFDDHFKTLKEAGYNINYKKNYLPQLWQESEERVLEVFQRRLGTRPSFTMETIFKSYKEGIEAGLTPRFQSVSELAGWYQHRVTKALADKNWFNYLADNTLIVPHTADAPRGWKSIDSDVFPTRLVKTTDGKLIVSPYVAPPALADAINNYLRTPTGFWANFARFAVIVKNIVLSAGVPGTGINAHGVNIFVRNVISARNPFSAFWRGFGYMLYPSLADRYIGRSLKMAQFAVRHGMRITTEEHVFGEIVQEITDGIVKQAGKKFLEVQRKLFEEPLFNKIIPALKIQYFETVYTELAQNYSQREAGRLAAEITNNSLGGINYDALGRSKELQNTLRSFILAPDWAETTLKLGGNIAKSLVGKGKLGQQYRVMARNTVMAYMSASLTNKLISGHWMHENEAGHTFEIEIGTDSEGKIRYLRPFGTAVDFVRIPFDVVAALAKGDVSSIPRVVRNRLSPVFASGVGLLYNIDWAGRTIYGNDKFGNPQTAWQQIGNIWNNLPGMPPYVRAPIDLATGKAGPEQAFMSAFEFPFRYSRSRGTPKGGKSPFNFGKTSGGGKQSTKSPFNF